MATKKFVPQVTVIDSGWLNDTDTSTYDNLGTAGGTANALVIAAAALPASLSALVAGQNWYLQPSIANLGAATLALGSLGTFPITKYGATALVAGDLFPGVEAALFFDGAQFQLLNPRNADLGTVTGVLAIASGGTGGTTAPAARTNLGSGTTGDAIFVASSVQTVRDVLALNQFGWRNRVRNGRMLINQRVLASTTANGAYVVDGWLLQNTGTNRVTGSQLAVSGILPAENVFRIQVTGTAGAPAAGDLYGGYQPVEGYSVADLGWGTAGAVGVVTSIRVRSSVAGTYALSFRNGASNRSYIAQFNINSANTFEDKVLYIPGDTTGTWLTNNGIGLFAEVTVACGSTYATTSGSWQAGNFAGLTGQTQLTATAGATFDFTLMQVEPARVATQPATPFEWIPFDEELRRAQRYLFSSYPYGVASGTVDFVNALRAYAADASNAWLMMKWPVQMRAAPPGSVIYGPSTGTVNQARNSSSGATVTVTSGTFGQTAPYAITSSGGFTVGQVYDFHLQTTAEL